MATSTAMVAAALLAASASTGETVTVVPTGADRYRLTIEGLAGSDERSAQASLKEPARRACGAKSVRWGRFQLRATVIAAPGKRSRPGSFVQDIECIPAPLPLVGGATVFTPTAADEQQVRAAALVFYARVDAGDADGALAMMTVEQRASMKEDRRRIDVGQAKGGRDAVARRIAKVTWYVDPPGVTPGVYAAADMTGSSRSAAVICGYVALYRNPASTWEIACTEEGRIDVRTWRRATTNQRQQLRSAVRCVG